MQKKENNAVYKNVTQSKRTQSQEMKKQNNKENSFDNNLRCQQQQISEQDEERGNLRRSREEKSNGYNFIELPSKIKHEVKDTNKNLNIPALNFNNTSNSLSINYDCQLQESNDVQNIKEIKGRKIDNPPLIVIKEMDEDNIMRNNFIQTCHIGTSQLGNIQQNQKKVKVQQQNLNYSIQNQRKKSINCKSTEQKKGMKQSIYKNKEILQQDHRQKSRLKVKGTKSSREIKTSMGFQELLNQLEKDVSMQQSNVVDFKNKTIMNSNLKLELSGIHKQSSIKKCSNKSNQLARSQEKIYSRQKSKCKKELKQNNVFQYTLNNNANFTPEKLINQGPTTTSFLNSEHGRCVTSQGYLNQKLNLTNVRTKSQTQLQNNLLCNKVVQNYPQTTLNQNQKDQSSPNRQIREFKSIGNIDKLIRDNIKKINKRQEDEKLIKQKSTENFKKKKDELEMKNNLVRLVNKQKIYRQSQYQQQFFLQQENDQVGIIESQDTYKLLRDQQKKQKQSYSQTIDYDKLKQAFKGKRININNHRKSYGLDFLEVKKEIQEELRTIDEKFKNNSELLDFNQNIYSFGKANNTDQSQKKLKIKQKEIIEKHFQNQNAPINKVIVVKKSKIRKFMKEKKKEIHCQQFIQKKEEIIKAYKLQENLSKLNQFCKKNLTKQNLIKLSKKRNATIQDNELLQQTKKPECKKKSLKVRGQSMKIIQNQDEELKQSSSKLSTEFYEEYFRLLNSIRKEQQESSYKPTLQDSDFNCSSLNQKQKVNQQSPTSFLDQHNKLNSPNQKQKSKRKSSKSGMKSKLTKGKQDQQRPPTSITGKEDHKELKIKQELKMSRNNRAESAPLLQQQQTSFLNHDKQSMRQNSVRFHDLIEKIVKIQRAYRNYLQERGFYQETHIDTSQYQTEFYNCDTVKKIENIDYQLQNVNQNQSSEVEFENNNLDENDQVDQQIDYDNFIIVNNQDNQDDQNKIIYLSNIDSCSLPLSPKENSQDQQQQQQLKKQVFDYQLDENTQTVKQLQRQPKQIFIDGDDNFLQEESKVQIEQPDQLDKQDSRRMLLLENDSETKYFKHHTPKVSHMLLNIKDSEKKSQYSSQSSVRNLHIIQSVDSKCSNKDHQTSQSSQSLFDRNSFQQFTQQKMNQFVQNNEFAQLIDMREKALEYKQKKEGKLLKKMHTNQQMSPRTYHSKKEQLEKWVRLEKEEIQKTKKAFQQEWQKTVKMIEETQKNVEQMRITMKVSLDNQKHSHQSLFNSQISRNSSQSNIATVQHEKRKEEDLKHNIFLQFSEEQQPRKEQRLIDYLEEKIQEKQNFIDKEQKKQKKQSQERQGIYIEDQNEKVVSSSEESQSQQDFQTNQNQVIKDDRHLIRSRSEQDLSELIRKTKIDISQEEQLYNFDTQQKLLSSPDLQNQITVERNLFQNFNQTPLLETQIKQFNDQQSMHHSVIDENDLNIDFQDQKFSIEDFKQLDKQKLLNEQFDIEIEEIKTNNKGQHDDIQNIFAQQELILQQNKKKIQIIEDYAQPMLEQNNILFQNAKPGENIKISDILKKSQNVINDGRNRYQDQNSLSQILFENHHIPYNIQTNLDRQQSLADLITEEILQQLLKQVIQVPIRVSENETSTQQSSQILENQDVFIIDPQQNEKDQRRDLIEERLRYQQMQDLQKVEAYVNEITQCLLQSEILKLTGEYNNINNFKDYHQQFLNVLTNPIQKNPLDILNQLQTSEIGAYEHFETAMVLTQHPILPIDLYLEIERQREESQMQDQNTQRLILENSIIQESVHIQNKAIFDSLNESLLKFRPYGIQGEPMLWSNKNRRLQTRVDANSVDTERLFEMVKQDVLRWNQTFAGCQPTQIFKFKKQDSGPEQFDDELFQEIRERRLAAMLASEVIETEHQWLNYEFEDAQVKIDLSDMILEYLVEEVVQFLCSKQNY